MHFIRILTAIPLLIFAVDVLSCGAMADEDFANITVEKVKESLKSRLNISQMEDLSRTVLEAKRMDLVSICLQDPPMSWCILEQAIALPDSPFKDRIVITMLRTPSPSWPKEGLRWGSRGLEFSATAEPFKSVIKRLLPGVSLSEELTKTRDARLKLAAELEKVVAAQSPQSNSR